MAGKHRTEEEIVAMLREAGSDTLVLVKHGSMVQVETNKTLHLTKLNRAANERDRSTC